MSAEKNNKNLHGHILYLDTSEGEAVLGLVNTTEERPTFHFERWEAGRQLSATLTKKVEDILMEYAISFSDLTGICVFVGPGSFTGLRIGLSYANGLAYALSIPIYETREKEKLDLSNPKEVAVPYYGAPPMITKSKK